MTTKKAASLSGSLLARRGGATPGDPHTDIPDPPAEAARSEARELGPGPALRPDAQDRIAAPDTARRSPGPRVKYAFLLAGIAVLGATAGLVAGIWLGVDPQTASRRSATASVADAAADGGAIIGKKAVATPMAVTGPQGGKLSAPAASAQIRKQAAAQPEGTERRAAKPSSSSRPEPPPPVADEAGPGALPPKPRIALPATVAKFKDAPAVPKSAAQLAAISDPRAKEPPAPKRTTVIPVSPVGEKPPPRRKPARSAPLRSAYSIQLSSLRSEAAARREMTRLRRRLRGLLGGRTLRILRGAARSGRTVYRVRLFGFDGPTPARKLCSRIKASRQNCLVVRR